MNYQNLVSVYLSQPSASADNTDLGFDNSWYHAQPHPITVYYLHGLFLSSVKNHFDGRLFWLIAWSNYMYFIEIGPLVIDFCQQKFAVIIIVIFNEDANITKWFTEGSSKEY